MTSPPTITLDFPVFDTAYPERDARFWADLLTGTVSQTDDDWHVVRYGNGGRLAFQTTPDHASPGWPQGQQQMHLDFVVDADDVQRAHDHALECGAELLSPADGPHVTPGAGGFVAYADPSGHPFCLCWRQ